MPRYHRTVAFIAAMLPSAAFAQAPSGFDAIAAGAERIDIRGVPMWMNGSFRVGTDGTRGTVKRVSVGETHDRTPPGAPLVATADVLRRGRVTFAVTGPAVGGAIAGECGFERAEVQASFDTTTISRPTLPLLYRCSFTRDGRAVGGMVLHAAPGGPGLVQPTRREGEVEVDGTTLAIASLHELGSRRVVTDMPVGYVYASAGETVGAIDVNGVSRRRLALPRDPAQRQAAMAASLALALFWDPGDTDD